MTLVRGLGVCATWEGGDHDAEPGSPHAGLDWDNLLVGTASLGASRFWGNSATLLETLPTARVERADLEVTVLVDGEIEGATRTTIECELEALVLPGSPGMGLPTILELVTDGAMVRKGDVLVRFDASSYEEMVRLQQIEVERATAERRQAEMDLEAQRVALRGFRDGEAIQQRQSFQGQIALARADLQQARERREWTRMMRENGYVSTDQLARARRTPSVSR